MTRTFVRWRKPLVLRALGLTPLPMDALAHRRRPVTAIRLVVGRQEGVGLLIPRPALLRVRMHRVARVVVKTSRQIARRVPSQTP